MTNMTERLRIRLLAQQASLTSDAYNNAEAAKPVELDQTRVGRLSRMDAMQNQAMSIQTQQRRQQQILMIKAALIRIDSDEFGYCLKCHLEIPIKRLEIDPCATLCINCAALLEEKNK